MEGRPRDLLSMESTAPAFRNLRPHPRDRAIHSPTPDLLSNIRHPRGRGTNPQPSRRCPRKSTTRYAGLILCIHRATPAARSSPRQAPTLTYTMLTPPHIAKPEVRAPSVLRPPSLVCP